MSLKVKGWNEGSLGWGFDEHAGEGIGKSCVSTNTGNTDLVRVNMVENNGHGIEWRGGELSDIERVFRKARLRRERVDVRFGGSIVLGSLGRAWKGSLGRLGRVRNVRRKRVRDVEWANACD